MEGALPPRTFPSIPVLATQRGQIGPPISCPVLSDTWQKNLKDLASRAFTKEIEPRTNEPGAEQRIEPGKKAFVSPSKALLRAWEGASSGTAVTVKVRETHNHT